MFTYFHEDEKHGIEIKQTGQKWYLNEDYEVEAFVRFLNNAAQQSAQAHKAYCYGPIVHLLKDGELCSKCGFPKPPRR